MLFSNKFPFFKVPPRDLTAPGLKHIVGVDQLRYVFAVWVLFTHGAYPPLFEGHSPSKVFDFFNKLYGWGINGEAAVIGFFIISGLCIHYPNIRRPQFNVKAFYVARFIRLGLPLTVILLIGKLIHYQHVEGFLRVVPIWSLYCELIYYVVYPAVLWFARKNMLIHLTVVSLIISILFMQIWAGDRAYAMTFHSIGGGGFFGWKVAIVAFPCWLFGVIIAERISSAKTVEKIKQTNVSIWRWRLIAILLSSTITPIYRMALWYHLINKPFIGLLLSSQLNTMLFGIYALFWIEKEVVFANFGSTSPSRWLEQFGLASYSLYLIHVIVMWYFNKLIPNYFPGFLLNWLLLLVVAHGVMFVFYKTVERPSHLLSKLSAAKLRK